MPDQAKGKHIFVVDDTPAIINLFQDLFEEEGYRVTSGTFSAVEGEQRLAAIKQAKPDLVVLDYIIGGEGVGWQLLQMLKMDRDTRALPVVVCTAAVRQIQELQPHLDEMGVAVVLKPFDIDRLLTEVANQLEKADEGSPPESRSNQGR